MRPPNRRATSGLFVQLLGALAIAGNFACGREGVGVKRTGVPSNAAMRNAGTRNATPISIAFDTTFGTKRATLTLNGLSTAELNALTDAHDTNALLKLMRISVQGHEDVTIAGRFALNDSSLAFVPQFPFDAGRSYAVRIDPRLIASGRSDSAQTIVLALPNRDKTPVTRVVRIFPGSDTLPENLLRLYVEFSEPMSHTGGLEYIKLLDEKKHEITHAFLPLDVAFWNEDRTRYTAFLDPGRVKRGILPNEQMGRAILAGHRYTIIVDSTWEDANGRALIAPYHRTFTVSAPNDTRIDLKRWRVAAPKPDSRDALVATFERPLDFGLLNRAVGVQSVDGVAIRGTINVERNETEWRFTPATSWSAGNYRVVVFSSLEDAEGNRADHPFEVDMFDRVDKAGGPERYFVPFVIRKQ